MQDTTNPLSLPSFFACRVLLDTSFFTQSVQLFFSSTIHSYDPNEAFHYSFLKFNYNFTGEKSFFSPPPPSFSFSSSSS